MKLAVLCDNCAAEIAREAAVRPPKATKPAGVRRCRYCGGPAVRHGTVGRPRVVCDAVACQRERHREQNRASAYRVAARRAAERPS
jgi:hypothetical protein